MMRMSRSFGSRSGGVLAKSTCSKSCTSSCTKKEKDDSFAALAPPRRISCEQYRSVNSCNSDAATHDREAEQQPMELLMRSAASLMRVQRSCEQRDQYRAVDHDEQAARARQLQQPLLAAARRCPKPRSAATKHRKPKAVTLMARSRRHCNIASCRRQQHFSRHASLSVS